MNAVVLGVGILTVWLVAIAMLPVRSAAWLASAGSLALAVAAGWALHTGHGLTLALPMPLPPLAVRVQGLPGFLLLNDGVLAAVTLACLGTQVKRPRTVAVAAATVPSAVLVLGGTNAFTILVGWEALGALGFALVSSDGPSARRHMAARTLLSFAEIGAAAWYALILVTGGARGELQTIASGPPVVRLGILALALLAFGSKAGMAPLPFWMPVAEPEAPGAAAGLLSGPLTMVAAGALLKIVQVLGPIDAAAGAGLALLGIAGAFWGGIRAMFAGHVKRVLAYGSVEAMNLVLVAIGVALLLRSLGEAGAAAAALTAAVLLAVTHATGKAALFVLTGVMDRLGLEPNLNRLGGLARTLPLGGSAAALAAAGLMGLPPLGGFVAEWLLLEACFMPTPAQPLAHAALALLGAGTAFIAAMSLTAYLRWFGMAFLGPARGVQPATEPDAGMHLASMGALLLASGQLLTGVGAAWFLPWIQALAGRLGTGPHLVPPLFVHPSLNPTLVSVGAQVGRGVLGLQGAVIVPNGGFSVLSPGDLAVAMVLAAGLVFLVLRRARGVRRVAPWAGGTALESPSLTYTASGLTMPLRLSLATVLGLRRSRVVDGDSAAPWPRRIIERGRMHDPFLRIPRATAHALAWSGRVVRRLASGHVGSYVLYVTLTLAAALAVVMAGSTR